MNTQQLVEIQMIQEGQWILQRQLEEQKTLLEKQGTLIEKMSKELDDKNKKIANIQEVVWQLINGLYNTDTQESVIHVHEHTLLNKKGLCPLYRPDENMWPTTRQGDLQTKQINNMREVLESVVLNLEIGKVITKQKGDTYFKLLCKDVDENDNNRDIFYILFDSSNDEIPFSQESSNMEIDMCTPHITNIN